MSVKELVAILLTLPEDAAVSFEEPHDSEKIPITAVYYDDGEVTVVS